MNVRSWLSAELVIMLVPSGVLGAVSEAVQFASRSVPLSTPEIVIVSVLSPYPTRSSNLVRSTDI